MITIVVGGQYGSEGKGKVAHWFARRQHAKVAVRVGGPNSGHTVIDDQGARLVLRQVPTPALIPGVLAAIGAGSYVDPDVLLKEISELKLDPSRLAIDPSAVVVSPDFQRQELESKLRDSIGSTLSGTGAAVLARIRRDGTARFVDDIDALRPFVKPVVPLLRRVVDAGERVLIEGTQGFGLSVLHAASYPYVTSRDTTAAGALSEVGMSPLDVDQVVMVLRAFPIRVGGNSGPLLGKSSWEAIARQGKHDHPIAEYTSVTGRLRRVGRFDSAVVRKAMDSTNPTTIVVNHLDYLDHACCVEPRVTPVIRRFVSDVEGKIHRSVDFAGLGPTTLVPWTSSVQEIDRRRSAAS